MKIKWKKLKKIVKKFTKKNITIALWTNMDNDINAFTDCKSTIILNGEKIKTLEQIFMALGHEITHINFSNMPEGTEKFNKIWQTYNEDIKIEYFKE